MKNLTILPLEKIYSDIMKNNNDDDHNSKEANSLIENFLNNGFKDKEPDCMLLLIMLSSSLVCISLRMPFDLS
jgi:hypothetical protein